MILSSEEKEIIEKFRKEKEDNLPKKEGYAKADLYSCDGPRYTINRWFLSSSEKEDMVKDFANNFIKLEIASGSKFDCYIEDGQERWYDTEGGRFNGMDSEWARKYLKNISIIKK